MQNLSKILAVIDPTVKDQPAIQRAAWLANQTGASLELLICYYNEYLVGDMLFDSISLEKARKEVDEGFANRLEEIAKPLRADGIIVNASAVWDHPLYEGIVRHAVKTKCDIVLKDTHHHSVISRSILTNTDWNLIRNCPIPLWLVKPVDFPDSPTFVAAVDPMHEHDKPAVLDDEVLRIGEIIATGVGGDLHAFHAYDPRIAMTTTTPDIFVPPASLPFDEIAEVMRSRHKKRFERLISYYDIEDDKAHLKEGLTHEELSRFAEELGASVVVMGTISRNRLKRLFVGATAERVLEHLPCDLLVVKPDWFQTPVQVEHDEAA